MNKNQWGFGSAATPFSNYFHLRLRKIIVGVKNEDPLLLQHLDKINIRLGLQIEVTEVNDFDQSMQVKLPNLDIIFLSKKITSQILIAKNS